MSQGGPDSPAESEDPDTEEDQLSMTVDGAATSDGPDGDGDGTLAADVDTEESVDHWLRDEVLSDAEAYFEREGTDEGFAGPPSEEYVRSEWFDFGFLDGHEVVEHYWVDEPFAFVAILEEEDRDKLRYRVVTPTLDPLEEYVRDNLVKVIRNRLMYHDLDGGTDREELFTERAKDIIATRAATTLSDGSLHKILYYLRRNFVRLGPIDPIMRDEAIEDISCDGSDIPVYVYHFDHRDLRTNITFDQQELSSFVLKLAQRAGEQISVSDPLVDGSLPDGSRVQLTFESDVSTRGSNFTIRKFATEPLTPIDLVQFGTFSIEQMAYFWLAIENNRSLIFAGGTGSGKTTSMNAVSMFIPEDSKIVSIEDTREVTLPHDNWVQSLTRNAIDSQDRGGISMYQLLQAALRQRPEYLVVGEIRTEQRVAFTFFQAIGTGHTAYTTIHADSMEGVLNRLENPPLSVPNQVIQELDIVSIQAQTFQDGTRVRRNQQVTEILPSQGAGESTRTLEIFQRDADADTISQVNNSQVLQDIAEVRGWDQGRLNREFNDRERMLEYLLENDISGFEPVAEAIYAFYDERERVLEEVEAGTFTPAEGEGRVTF